MEAKFNITIKLSPDDVKQIIAEYLAKEGYSVKPDDIKFGISEKCHGYGMGEHYTTVFSGCSVKCDVGGKQ